ncbi:MAG: hypothetical protein JNM84_16755 [Planctomycetes bacterium]|nr:hypothetical protein [Planctomycetota bacterium]
MRPTPFLRRLRRRFRTRHGATWALSALILAVYAAMVAQQIRAAISGPAGPAASRAELVSGEGTLAGGPQRQ